MTKLQLLLLQIPKTMIADKLARYNLDPLRHIFNDDFNINVDNLDIKLLMEEVLGLENNHGDYEDLVGKLKSNQYAYIIDGIRLHLIQKYKLYLPHYKSFKDFVKYELNRSPHTVRLNIIAADVAIQLIGLGYEDLPHNISQANTVMECANEKLPIGLVWKQVLDTYQPWQITRKKILELFKPSSDYIEPENKFVMLPWSLYKRIAELALGVRKSVVQYLDEITERSTNVENYLLIKLMMMTG